jgi:hypothetical protein
VEVVAALHTQATGSKYSVRLGRFCSMGRLRGSLLQASV